MKFNKSKSKIYIAAPFFNEKQLARVVEVETFLRDNLYNFYSPRSEGVLKEMDVESQKRSRKQIFDKNIANMECCTHMIAIVDEKDSGTLFEIGYFYKSGKPIILKADDVASVNVMLAESAVGICTNTFHIPSCFAGTYTELPKEYI